MNRRHCADDYCRRGRRDYGSCRLRDDVQQRRRVARPMLRSAGDRCERRWHVEPAVIDGARFARAHVKGSRHPRVPGTARKKAALSSAPSMKRGGIAFRRQDGRLH